MGKEMQKCMHHWVIQSSTDINPDTQKEWGQFSPGICKKCKVKKMHSNSMPVKVQLTI